MLGDYNGLLHIPWSAGAEQLILSPHARYSQCKFNLNIIAIYPTNGSLPN